MHRIALITATLLSWCGLAASGALADDSGLRPPTLVVSGYGSVEYRPDTAHVTLGVRAEAPTAAAASAQAASGAQSVVAAMRRLGIADRDLRTTGFSLYYQQPQPRPMPMMMSPPNAAPAPPASSTGGASVAPPNEPRRPFPIGGGTYVATEEIIVKTTPAQAGNAIDAAVGAGANQTYGLTFDSSARDALMRQALERAVKNARENANAIAAASGLRIVGVQTIESGGGPPRVLGMRSYDALASMGPASAPPILSGTDTLATSVVVVFRVR